MYNSKMDYYNFISIVDDIFKECNSVEEMCARYVKLKESLDCAYKQNLVLKKVAKDSTFSSKK